MSLLGSPIHEYGHDMIEDYENQELNDDRDSLNGAGEGNEYDGEDDGETKGRRIDPTKKHIARNPIPKLNTERLKGPKGIQEIEKYFDGFKFHGKGHEKTDLDAIMKRLEHWSHRLYPKLDFDDFIDKVEKLGTKKDLQVFIKKYRLDMLTSDDCVIPNDENDQEDGEDTTTALIDELDILIDEQIERQKQNTTSHANSLFDELLNNSTDVATQDENYVTETTTVPIEKEPEIRGQPERIEESRSTPLTDEVKEQIERNRQLAIQRRLERLKALEEETKKKLETSQEIEKDTSDMELDKDDELVKNVNDISQNESTVSTQGQTVEDIEMSDIR